MTLGSLKLAVVGVATPQKWANAANQGHLPTFHCMRASEPDRPVQIPGPLLTVRPGASFLVCNMEIPQRLSHRLVVRVKHNNPCESTWRNRSDGLVLVVKISVLQLLIITIILGSQPLSSRVQQHVINVLPASGLAHSSASSSQ